MPESRVLYIVVSVVTMQLFQTLRTIIGVIEDNGLLFGSMKLVGAGGR